MIDIKDLKVGDKVKIVKAGTFSKGYCWISPQDAVIGQIGIVELIKNVDNPEYLKIKVRTDKHTCWAYGLENLDWAESKELDPIAEIRRITEEALSND